MIRKENARMKPNAAQGKLNKCKKQSKRKSTFIHPNSFGVGTEIRV